MWSKLKHPNVLSLLGTLNDPNLHPVIPAMVCPWMENGALTMYLERNDDLKIAERLALVSIHRHLWPKCRLVSQVNDVAHGLRYGKLLSY